MIQQCWGSLQLRIAGHRQRAPCREGETGLLQGSGTSAEFLVAEMQHSPAVCRGRIGRESRNENPNVCLSAAEDGTESKALNADGSEGARDAVD